MFSAIGETTVTLDGAQEQLQQLLVGSRFRLKSTTAGESDISRTVSMLSAISAAVVVKDMSLKQLPSTPSSATAGNGWYRVCLMPAACFRAPPQSTPHNAFIIPSVNSAMLLCQETVNKRIAELTAHLAQHCSCT